MANSMTTITWDIAEDPFNTTNVGEEGLDKKWFELAELLLGEDSKAREQKISDFKSLLYADPKLSKFITPNLLESEAYLIIYLRAGAWDVTQALAVLNGFYSLGLNYKPYVEMSIPSK